MKRLVDENTFRIDEVDTSKYYYVAESTFKQRAMFVMPCALIGFGKEGMISHPLGYFTSMKSAFANKNVYQFEHLDEALKFLNEGETI